MNEIKSLGEIVKELISCGYTCEAGPLENNEDFRQLARIAGVWMGGRPAREFLAEQRELKQRLFRGDFDYGESAQQARDRIVEHAKQDLADHIYAYSLSAEGLEFVVNRNKRVVVALLKSPISGSVLSRGIAKCNPDDCFNVHIGKAIALRRALGLKVPAEYLNAPQPTEVRVGDVIRYWEGIRGPLVVEDDHNPGINLLKQTYLTSASGFSKIIDDSREMSE